MPTGRPSALPQRAGRRPNTTQTNPHSQIDQQPDPAITDLLAEKIFALPDVVERPSAISVPGARALCLNDDVPINDPQAILIGREFAHLHPHPDHSLHAALPLDRSREAIKAGWAEPHVFAHLIYDGLVMLYAPRDDAEVEVIAGLVEDSYRFAGGR